MKEILGFIMLVWWIHGIAVAKSVFGMFVCAIFPPAAWVTSLQWLIEQFVA